ncbi:hypothetical protein KM043_004180 [Ampulex compressa]|nr:hypothetical protein KM043_004180 [Ampulex compressa]
MILFGRPSPKWATRAVLPRRRTRRRDERLRNRAFREPSEWCAGSKMGAGKLRVCERPCAASFHVSSGGSFRRIISKRAGLAEGLLARGHDRGVGKAPA